MFDKEKVLTPFTAHKAVVGSYGYLADTVEAMECAVKADTLSRLDSVSEGSTFPFNSNSGVPHEYFLPAPYEVMQKKWVREVGLKVGDKVKLTRGWCKGEGGYDDFYRIFHEKGKVYTVTEIKPKHIKVDGEGYIALTYFALEKVEEAPTTYRPFADAEEFSMYERLTLRKGDDRFVVLSYNNTGVVISSWREPENVYSNGDVVGRIVGGGESKHYPYKELLEEGFLFNSSQKPAGVKL